MSSNILPGSLLIAHPSIKRSLFEKSVVVIIEVHNRLYKGLIVNKKGHYLIKDVLDECEQTYVGQSPLFRGGPANTSSLIMLHSDDWYSSNTRQLGYGLSISSDSVMVEKLSVDNVPYNYKIIAGISQWSETQLKHELAQTEDHAPYWLILNNYETNLLFEDNTDGIWELAVEFYSQNMYDQYF